MWGDLLCTDKTGTLNMNQMAVDQLCTLWIPPLREVFRFAPVPLPLPLPLLFASLGLGLPVLLVLEGLKRLQRKGACLDPAGAYFI